MNLIDKIKEWLEREVEHNNIYGDDPTDVAKDLLTKIKDWETEK
tara:strand:+ start:423 stop:554 length:132 start_codon:yes stop_codon:yes gene_type:complete